jgi:hypothetical protein
MTEELMNINRVIQDNKKTLDSIQEMASELADKALPGVEAGLTTADMTKLHPSTGEVQKLTRTLQDLLTATR